MEETCMEKVLNWYVIWFVLYALILYLPLCVPTNLNAFTIGGFVALFGVFVVAVFLLSNVIGLGLAFNVLYDALSDIRLYSCDNMEWLAKHSHGIGTEGFSIERIVEHDVMSMVMVLIFISHLLLSVKRCKENGVSAWLALVPLYNPLGLFYKKGLFFKRNKEPEI